MVYATATINTPITTYTIVFHKVGNPEKRAIIIIRTPRRMIIWRFDIVHMIITSSEDMWKLAYSDM